MSVRFVTHLPQSFGCKPLLIISVAGSAIAFPATTASLQVY
ncbi:hypothetical protein [Nostoc sp. FACHB-110]|nr:hypothetical protein [Nostoc sp. FACHB-110]